MILNAFRVFMFPSSVLYVYDQSQDFSQGVENMKKTEVYVINGQEGRKGTQVEMDFASSNSMSC